jgi:hypothetical protein
MTTRKILLTTADQLKAVTFSMVFASGDRQSVIIMMKSLLVAAACNAVNSNRVSSSEQLLTIRLVVSSAVLNFTPNHQIPVFHALGTAGDVLQTCNVWSAFTGMLSTQLNKSLMSQIKPAFFTSVPPSTFQTRCNARGVFLSVRFAKLMVVV